MKNNYFIFFLITQLVNICHSNSGIDSVSCQTTKGPIKIEVYKEWAPLGAERFLDLVKDGFYSDIALYRCVKGFLTQFGISDDPKMKHWHRKQIADDTNIHKGIHKHYVSFAGGGPNTRTTQIFIAFEELDFLGNSPWETPFGKVVEGGNVLDALYKGYGDIPPFGKGPDQGKLFNQGNSYIRENFPLIDFLVSCEMASGLEVANTVRISTRKDEESQLPLQQQKQQQPQRTQELLQEEEPKYEIKPLILDVNDKKTFDEEEAHAAEKEIVTNIRRKIIPDDRESDYHVALTAITLLGFALAILYTLSQYKPDTEMGKAM